MAAQKKRTKNKRPTAAEASPITNWIGRDRHYVQHGRNHRVTCVCFAVPDRRKALHLNEDSCDRGTLPANRLSNGYSLLPRYSSRGRLRMEKRQRIGACDRSRVA
jgi:hypothetical protein